MQQKAMQLEGNATISSKNLPHPIFCNQVFKTSYEKNITVLTDFKFSRTAPAKRKKIRLVPDEKHSVFIFVKKQKFRADLNIIDISLNSIKISSNYSPTILNENDKVFVNMILTYQKKPLIINLEATLIKKTQAISNSTIIFKFDLESEKKHLMLKYLGARQIEIIKEFKAFNKKPKYT